MKKIGIIGFAGAGKDTLADLIIKHYTSVPWVKHGFADALREAVYELNPYVFVHTKDEVSMGYHPYKELINLYGYEWTKRNSDARETLQRMGTDVARKLWGNNFWVDIARESASKFSIFPDTRFANEATMITDDGGIILRVTRANVKRVNEHPSEDYAENGFATYTIVNQPNNPDAMLFQLSMHPDLVRYLSEPI